MRLRAAAALVAAASGALAFEPSIAAFSSAPPGAPLPQPWRALTLPRLAPAELPFADRVRMKFARLVYGSDLPTAAICYVWDNRHRAGAAARSAYSDGVRIVVLESGSGRAGQWLAESGDLDSDFRAAFPERGDRPAPPLTGNVAGNDTDQTGEGATAWLGDFRIAPAALAHR